MSSKKCSNESKKGSAENNNSLEKKLCNFNNNYHGLIF